MLSDLYNGDCASRKLQQFIIYPAVIDLHCALPNQTSRLGRARGESRQLKELTDLEAPCDGLDLDLSDLRRHFAARIPRDKFVLRQGRSRRSVQARNDFMRKF